uniref:Uncharacterized protein n=1 Tax=Polytomella parva TaxID=51329 RepID=A0A7S0YC41_9CHLO|mmetsp:Transcript_16808/g.30475  ORF Transcript_16808/g.30475 Transcript_16808/m.30475 type:complete len:204 (+) Transcript_16808:460-1071(+)
MRREKEESTSSRSSSKKRHYIEEIIATGIRKQRSAPNPPDEEDKGSRVNPEMEKDHHKGEKKVEETSMVEEKTGITHDNSGIRNEEEAIRVGGKSSSIEGGDEVGLSSMSKSHFILFRGQECDDKDSCRNLHCQHDQVDGASSQKGVSADQNSDSISLRSEEIMSLVEGGDQWRLAISPDVPDAVCGLKSYSLSKEEASSRGG